MQLLLRLGLLAVMLICGIGMIGQARCPDSARLARFTRSLRWLTWFNVLLLLLWLAWLFY